MEHHQDLEKQFTILFLGKLGDLLGAIAKNHRAAPISATTSLSFQVGLGRRGLGSLGETRAGSTLRLLVCATRTDLEWLRPPLLFSPPFLGPSPGPFGKVLLF